MIRILAHIDDDGDDDDNCIIDCAKLGADVMTGPLSSIEGLLKHPLTDIGLAQFLKDYKKGN